MAELSDWELQIYAKLTHHTALLDVTLAVLLQSLSDVDTRKQIESLHEQTTRILENSRGGNLDTADRERYISELLRLNETFFQNLIARLPAT
jgi:hypothetical protein